MREEKEGYKIFSRRMNGSKKYFIQSVKISNFFTDLLTIFPILKKEIEF